MKGHAGRIKFSAINESDPRIGNSIDLNKKLVTGKIPTEKVLIKRLIGSRKPTK